ncbi:hypothetical protein [Phyllobacterium sp. K27]
MRSRFLAFLGFATLAAFLAILIWRVPRLDLGLVTSFTVAMAFYDFFLFRRKKNS